MVSARMIFLLIPQQRDTAQSVSDTLFTAVVPKLGIVFYFHAKTFWEVEL